MTELEPVLIPVEKTICPSTGLSCLSSIENMSNLNVLASNFRVVEEVWDMIETDKSDERLLTKMRKMLNISLARMCPEIVNDTCEFINNDGEISG